MKSLNTYIDHTYLKPDLTPQITQQWCEEALQHQFKSVCLPLIALPLASELLVYSSVLLGTVIGFPLGYDSLKAKLNELDEAFSFGVQEVDVVHNLTYYKSKNFKALEHEIETISNLTSTEKVTLKVILETDLLEPLEVQELAHFYSQYPIQFLKTSTGFIGKGATVEMVQLLKANTLDSIEIKASGGLRTAEDCFNMIDAGATRLGTSQALSILQSLE